MPHCYNAQLNIKERHARTSANESKHINAKFLCTFVTLFKVIALPLKRRRTPYGFSEHHHCFLMVLCKNGNEYMKNLIQTTSRIRMKNFKFIFQKYRGQRSILIYQIMGVENLNIFKPIQLYTSIDYTWYWTSFVFLCPCMPIVSQNTYHVLIHFFCLLFLFSSLLHSYLQAQLENIPNIHTDRYVTKN